MLSLEDRIAYWKMLVRQEPTGNAQVDRGSLEEIRVALRDALLEMRSLQQRVRHLEDTTCADSSLSQASQTRLFPYRKGAFGC